MVETSEAREGFWLTHPHALTRGDLSSCRPGTWAFSIQKPAWHFSPSVSLGYGDTALQALAIWLRVTVDQAWGVYEHRR
jgi:hypothetical protein